MYDAQGLRQVTNMRLMPDMALRLGIAAVATSFFGIPMAAVSLLLEMLIYGDSVSGVLHVIRGLF